MSNNKSIFLCDFGGTNIRLATLGAHGPEAIRPYVIKDWPDMAAVLKDYADDYDGVDFYLAHTGHIRDDRLNLGYKKSNTWSFALSEVSAAFSMNCMMPLNDLTACGYAAFDTENFAFNRLRGEDSEISERIMIGIGTGAGHALLSKGMKKVHETYGGHFPLTAVSARARNVANFVHNDIDGNRTIIFEDVLSGAGLFRIYRALAHINNAQPKAENVFDLIPLKSKDPLVAEAASVFCEFLGLYAHILCSVVHAYGGVYLCGGVTRRLVNANLFDNAAFFEQFNQNMVPVVAHSLENTPIYMAEDEYTALHGLSVYARALS